MDLSGKTKLSNLVFLKQWTANPDSRVVSKFLLSGYSFARKKSPFLHFFNPVTGRRGVAAIKNLGTEIFKYIWL